MSGNYEQGYKDGAIKELKKLKENLSHTRLHGCYDLHKYTDEYGMVMTIHDLFSIIDEHIEDLER